LAKISKVSLTAYYLYGMKCRLKVFGIGAEILGGREVEVDFPGLTVGDLRQFLVARYPQLGELRSLYHQYATDQQAIAEGDEIALIPPVSGG
jgi:molybdopterin converting factor small subunit